MCSYPMPLKIKSMVDKYSLMERAVSLRINKYLNIKVRRTYSKSLQYIAPGIITKEQTKE